MISTVIKSFSVTANQCPLSLNGRQNSETRPAPKGAVRERLLNLTNEAEILSSKILDGNVNFTLGAS